MHAKGDKRVHSAHYDPTVGWCLGPYGGPRGVTLFNPRGTPVHPKFVSYVRCVHAKGDKRVHSAPDFETCKAPDCLVAKGEK